MQTVDALCKDCRRIIRWDPGLGDRLCADCRATRRNGEDPKTVECWFDGTWERDETGHCKACGRLPREMAKGDERLTDAPKTWDFSLLDGGSICLLRPLTDAARAWVEEHIGEDSGYHPNWPEVVIERRYVEDILEGVAGDGLAVRHA